MNFNLPHSAAERPVNHRVANADFLMAFLAFLWLGALLSTLWWSTGPITRDRESENQFLKLPTIVELDTRLVNIVTLGHRGLFDDFMTTWALQILMDPRVKTTQAESLQKILGKVTRHHPRLESFYLLSAFVLGLDLNRPDLTESILKDGLKAMGESWRIPLTMGFLAQNKLQNIDLATVYYGIASQKPGVPPYIISLAGKLQANQNLTPLDLEQTINSILSPNDSSKKSSKMQEVLNKRHDPSSVTP